MPARKTPPGFKDKHYDAEQVMEMFNVSQSKAYDIIHQCRPYGSVLKIGGTLRVSETALSQWYEAHNIQSTGDDGVETPAGKALRQWEEVKKRRTKESPRGVTACEAM